MPCIPSETEPHRSIIPAARFVHSACVARPVNKIELESNEDARKARDAEWTRLWDKGVWDASSVREWSDVARDARERGEEIHLGRLFCFCVEKGSELPPGDPRKVFKYRVVFQGNGVVNQSWEVAIFQDLGSSPACMEAGKAADCYGCFPDHVCQQADAEQAYAQADLLENKTWVSLPTDAWPKEWHTQGWRRPVVLLKKALYGHPVSGTYWEKHCNSALCAGGL